MLRIMYLDDKQVGTSPMTLQDVVAGVHEIKFVMDGYRSDKQEINIAFKQTLDLKVQMTAKPGKEYGKQEANQEESPSSSSTQDSVYLSQFVEKMPEYPGGEAALQQFIRNNLSYPQYARNNRISGKVVCTFVIDETGKVTDPKVVTAPHESLGSEAISLLTKMPRWKPGVNNGKRVKVLYVLPVRFSLPDVGETSNKMSDD